MEPQIEAHATVTRPLTQDELKRELAGASQQLLEALFALDREQKLRIVFDSAPSDAALYLTFDTRNELATECTLEAAARAIRSCASELGATTLVNPQVSEANYGARTSYVVECGFAYIYKTVHAPVAPSALLREALKKQGSALCVSDAWRCATDVQVTAPERCRFSARAIAQVAERTNKPHESAFYTHLARIVMVISHDHGTISNVRVAISPNGDAHASWVRF